MRSGSPVTRSREAVWTTAKHKVSVRRWPLQQQRPFPASSNFGSDSSSHKASLRNHGTCDASPLIYTRSERRTRTVNVGFDGPALRSLGSQRIHFFTLHDNCPKRQVELVGPTALINTVCYCVEYAGSRRNILHLGIVFLNTRHGSSKRLTKGNMPPTYTRLELQRSDFHSSSVTPTFFWFFPSIVVTVSRAV